MPRARSTKEYLELTGKINNQKQYKDLAPSKGLPTSIPTDAALKCPTKYCKRTKDAWHAIVPSLTVLGVLNVQDLAALEMMFSAHEQYVKAEEALRKYMATEFDPSNFTSVKHMRTLSTVMNESISTFIKVSTKFGITPTERTKLVFNSEEKEKDPLSIVLGE